MSDARITIALARAERTIAGLCNSAGTSHGITLAGFDAAQGVAKAQRDFEVFAEILKAHPGEVGELVDLVVSGRMTRAHAIAERVGLTEANLQRKGGGLPWIIIAVAIACLFLEHD